MNRLSLWLRPLLGTLLLVALSSAAAVGAARSAHADGTVGKTAIELTRQILAFGPRPPGSPELRKVQEWVERRLQSGGLIVRPQEFEAGTPKGKLKMRNIVAVLPGRTDRYFALACHLDSKLLPPEERFVGANDAAAACALLLALLPHLKQPSLHATIWLIFFDGEEALVEWSASDSLYGSRHLAAELAANGQLAGMQALLLLDMIADRDLSVALDTNSSPALIDRARRIVERRGWNRHFFQYTVAISDDHLPFAARGIPVLDLIDFRYGPPAAPSAPSAGAYFHSHQDTIDKLSSDSLQIIAELVLELLSTLDQELKHDRPLAKP